MLIRIACGLLMGLAANCTPVKEPERVGVNAAPVVPPPVSSAVPTSVPPAIDAGPPRIAKDGCAVMQDKALRATSPDGHIVVYVATDRARQDETTVDSANHQDLCIARDGGEGRILLEGKGIGPNDTPESYYADFSQFVFSPDSKVLFFATAGWVTSSAAHSIELDTGKVAFLFDGAVMSAITRGPYAGKYLAYHFRIDPLHKVDSPKYRGRMDVWDIVSANGTRVRPLPENETARNTLMGL